MYYDDLDKDPTTGQLVESGSMESSEEAFLAGYEQEEDIDECEECGSAVYEDGLRLEIDGEQLAFCSKECAEEYKESSQ